MKFIGMILIIVCTTLIGYITVDKNRRILKIYESLIYFCQLISIDFSSNIEPITLSVGSALKTNNLKNLDFISVDNLICKKTINSILTVDENKKLADFLYKLGKTDLNSQRSMLDGYNSHLELKKSEYMQKLNKFEKIDIGFGFFGGILICLILA